MAEAVQAQPAWVLLAYLIAGVCFVLALRGVCEPLSSRRGNLAGMVGVTIAVLTTLATHEIASLAEIIGAMVLSSSIGLITARKIQMTAMPQLVAAFHSLVGLAAVLVGSAAYLNPEAFGFAVRIAPIASPSVMSGSRKAGCKWGWASPLRAVTFSGSVIAFLKLNGTMSGKPILLPLRHFINLGALAGRPRAHRLLHAGPIAVGCWAPRRGHFAIGSPHRSFRRSGAVPVRDLNA